MVDTTSTEPGPEPAAATPRTQRKGSLVGLVSSNLAALALNLATSPLIARSLGPAGRGQQALVGVYDEASTQVFNFGVPIAIGFYAKEDRYPAEALMGTAWRYGLLALPVSLAGGFAAVWWPLSGLDGASRVLAFLLIGLSPIANTIGMASRQLLLAQGNLAGMRTLSLVQAVVRTALLAAFFAVDRLSVAVAIGSIAASNYVGHAYAWRKCAVRPHGNAPLRVLLHYGIRAVPGSLSNLANNRLDQLLIAPFLGAAALGQYAVAVSVNAIPQQVGTAMALDSFNKVRVEGLRGREGAASRLIRRAWVASLLSMAIVGVVATAGIPLVYGDAFRPAIMPTLILLPGAVFFAVHLVVAQIAYALGKPQFASVAQVVAVIVTILALPPAIHYYGIAGAAWVSTVAYAIRLITIGALLRRIEVTHTLPGPADFVHFAALVLGKLGRLRFRPRGRRRRPRRT
jgi:O-antigen/teichoic acid export membrane protein